MRERLQKIISACCGVSRRRAEELIAGGLVSVNGKVAFLGDSADIETDTITLQGKPIKKQEEKIYIMLNKPVGYVTTMNDEKGRKTVRDLVSDVGTRVYPVGRLDLNSAGLLLMTNDGDFANKIMHPSFEKKKTYIVLIKGDIYAGAARLKEPMELDGVPLRRPDVKILRSETYGGELEITIHEGKNRQVRRMCDIAGLKVISLRRIAVGGLKLGDLPKGRWRRLTAEELAILTKK